MPNGASDSTIFRWDLKAKFIKITEVQTKVKICRELYHEKYNTKYPAVFNYAGKFPDKVVGARYGISGSTVCVLRKMMGIPKYRKNQ